MFPIPAVPSLIVLAISPPDSSPPLWVNATFLAGIIAAVVTIIGWWLTRWWEARIRRLEQNMKYCERQIEEFYGPLYNVMHQIFAAEEVQDSFLQAEPTKEQDIRDYFQKRYFRPPHSEMLRILKERLHLAEGDAVPPSYEEYLKHACDDRTRGELKIYPPRNLEWPPDFETQLSDDFKRAMRTYEILLQRLSLTMRRKSPE